MSGQRIIYIVTQGEYSDYQIVCVFDDKEIAARYAEPFGCGVAIEEYTLNEYADQAQSGRFPFSVHVWKDGDGARAYPVNQRDEVAWSIGRTSKPTTYQEEGMGRHRFVPGDLVEVLRGVVMARDEAHAIKIANERRTQLLATGEWDRLRDANK